MRSLQIIKSYKQLMLGLESSGVRTQKKFSSKKKECCEMAKNGKKIYNPFDRETQIAKHSANIAPNIFYTVQCNFR